MANTRTVPKRRRFLGALTSMSPKKRFLLFIAIFAIIGGGYMAYRSFAFTALVKADGEFTPLVPARVLDTRTTVGNVGVPIGPNKTVQVQITGQGGVPAANVKAVVMNVTVVDPSAQSFVTIWPSGTGRPTSSNLNFNAGQIIANQVTVKVGADGKVQLFNANGNVNVIFDVAGYYATENGTPGARFNSVTPTRILDTRNGTGGYNTPVGNGQTIPVQVSGRNGIPATGVRAVVMNVTSVGATAGSYLSIWPTGQPRPTSSNLNFVPGNIIANQVTVQVGADGKVNLFNAVGATNVIFDVAGYFKDAEPGYERTRAGRFVAIDPIRVLDTRNTGRPIGQTPSPIRGLNGPAGTLFNTPIQAVVMNATITNPSASSFLTLWPGGSPQPPRPISSNINFGAGQIIANQVTTATTEGGDVLAYNAVGNTHLVLDLAGYYLADSDEVGDYIHNYLAFGNSGTNSRKLEFDYRLASVPNAVNSPSLRITPAFIYISANNDYISGATSTETTIIYSGGRSSTLSSSCRPDNTCKVLAAGGTITTQSSGWKFISIPYTGMTAGGVYRFTSEIVNDQPDMAGQWEIVSITSGGTKKQLYATYVKPTAGFQAKYIGVNFGIGTNNRTSCKSPQLNAFTLENFTADGVPLTGIGTSHAEAGSSVNPGGCPGLSRISIDRAANSVSYASGLSKATRDTTPPKVNSATLTGSNLSVNSSDNAAITTVNVDVDGQAFYYTNRANGIDIMERTAITNYSLSGLAPGNHSLHIVVTDNSGNLSEKTQTITTP